MEANAERLLWQWKLLAIASLLVAACLLAALVAVVVRPSRAARVTDDRLLGTWQSDADRTIAGLRENRPVADKQEAALRSLFGKLRVTYTTTTLTSDLDGVEETNGYEVVGIDEHSVAIREIKAKPSSLDGLVKMSEFTIIQFDGPDSYWVHTRIGGIREYFRRVR